MSLTKEEFIITHIYNIAKDPIIDDYSTIAYELFKYIDTCNKTGLINLCYQNGYIPTFVYDFDETLHNKSGDIYHNDVFDTVVECINNNIFVLILSYSGTGRTPEIIQIMDKWFLNKKINTTCANLIAQNKIAIKPIGPASMIYRHFDEADLYNVCTGKKCAIRYKLYNNTNYIILANIGDKYRDSEPYISGNINLVQGINPVDLIEQDIISVLYNGKIFKIKSKDNINEIDKRRNIMDKYYNPILDYKVNNTIDQYIDHLDNKIQQNIMAKDSMQYGYIETLNRDMNNQCLLINNKNSKCNKFVKPSRYDTYVGDIAESYLP